MKKFLLSILKLIEWIIFLTLIVILLLVASPLLPTKEYISTHVVSTGSMEPEIMTGSVVFSSLETDEINPGDIIVFKSPQNKEVTVVHRVMEINDGEYVTKGDNNENNDDWVVSDDDILGSVVFTVPYLGYAIEFLKTPLGFGLGVGIPALILIIAFIKKIRDGINDKVREKTEEEITKSKLEPPVLGLIILLSSFIFLSSSPKVYALFSSTVSIEGITITVGEITTPKVIINEVMWSGTSQSLDDQWIELYNPNTEDINIGKWRIYNSRDLNKPAIMIPANSVIPANGYFLISNYSNESSNSLLNVEVDVVNGSLYLLPEGNGNLLLEDIDGNIVDKALGDWPSDIQGDTYNSMQRVEGSIDGLLPINWYSCTSDSSEYWKFISGIDFGTPRAINSEF